MNEFEKMEIFKKIEKFKNSGKKILFACDLDNTLIHSYKKKQEGDICIEWVDGREQGFISPGTLAFLKNLPDHVAFAPVTTRSVEQYRRIQLFGKNADKYGLGRKADFFPRYAITSNGGTLLDRGEIDVLYKKKIDLLVGKAKNELDFSFDFLQKNIACEKYRMVDDIFIFGISPVSGHLASTLRRHLNLRNVDVFSHAHKLYIFPKGIDKGQAVLELKSKINASYVICAGDSELDIPMLKVADFPLLLTSSFAFTYNIPI